MNFYFVANVMLCLSSFFFYKFNAEAEFSGIYFHKKFIYRNSQSSVCQTYSGSIPELSACYSFLGRILSSLRSREVDNNHSKA